MAKSAKRSPFGGGKRPLHKLDDVYAEVVERTDAFCAAHLDAEYADLCRMLAENLRNERPSPLLKGTPAGWAGGIVYTVGRVNFLSDPDQRPHMKSEDLYKHIGVSEATVQARARDIRVLYDLGPMDPRLSRRSMLDDNPMVWMFELENGLIDDARRYPRAAQEQLVQLGIIPYVHPTARDVHNDDDGDGGGEEAGDNDGGSRRGPPSRPGAWAT